MQDLLIDLDNTVYPEDSNIFAQIDLKMKSFIAKNLNVSLDEAFKIQKKYFVNNGTTLRGFCTNCLDEKDDLAFSLIYPQSQGGGARVKYYPGIRAGLEVIHRF